MMMMMMKSVFEPTTCIVFLGFIVDSANRCFRITENKKQKFAQLRDKILSQRNVSVLDLQKLAGRCVSFMLAVPASKLYTREMNIAIAEGIRNSRLFVRISEQLREEIRAWLFLDGWKGKLEWKTERHISVTIYTDASTFKWAGIVQSRTGPVDMSDYWPEEQRHLPIMVLEAKSLLHVLEALKDNVRGHRVVGFVDSKVLIDGWSNEGCKCSAMNSVLKEIFSFCLEYDLVLKLVYVKSKDNPADFPSRELKKIDACLTEATWQRVQEKFGNKSGHSIDLMALDSNCMRHKDGSLLKHFSPYNTPLSSGTDMFCQHVSEAENCYVFPPFSLILPTLRLPTLWLLTPIPGCLRLGLS
ncbi:MAG: hypothetical protein AB2708_11875, partial [Candidatus Thiodiazotropha taylori]